MKPALKSTGWILFLLFTGLSVTAQKLKTNSKALPPAKIRNLTIGKQVPDVWLNKIINDQYTGINISEFKDKLLIIDFWATTCSGCVAALPKMDALQQFFKEKIKILPVTYEKESMVVAFLKKNKHTKNLVVPSVVEDKVLSGLFRHFAIPHEIWIYKGKVIAITGPDYVNSANIQAVLDGKPNSWPLKDDFLPAFNKKTPVLKVDTTQYADRQGMLKYSAIFGYRDGMDAPEGITVDSIRHTRRTFFVNKSILVAYCQYWDQLRYPAGSTGMYPEPNRVLLEVKDPSRFASYEEAGLPLEEWKRRTLFCYESVVPDTLHQGKEEQAKYILSDLDHLLGLRGRYENRKVKCLVLKRTVPEDRLKSNGGEQDMQYDTPVKIIRNSLLKDFVWKLNKSSKIPPVFDETGYADKVDMELKIGDLSDIPALRKALLTYGLDLKEEERILEMLVFTETN